MFAPRPHEMPRLPSFDELMHSIIGQPSPDARHDQLYHHLISDNDMRYTQMVRTRNLHPLKRYHSVGRPLDTINLISKSSEPKSGFPRSSDSLSSPSISSSSTPLVLVVPPIESPPSPASSKSAESHNELPAGSPRSYVCKTCGRPFTTSGHLARHNRIHTGERNHKCPFPKCDARFARQDNCTQHYRTHLSGKGKKSRGKKDQFGGKSS